MRAKQAEGKRYETRNRRQEKVAKIRVVPTEWSAPGTNMAGKYPPYPPTHSGYEACARKVDRCRKVVGIRRSAKR